MDGILEELFPYLEGDLWPHSGNRLLTLSTKFDLLCAWLDRRGIHWRPLEWDTWGRAGQKEQGKDEQMREAAQKDFDSYNGYNRTGW